MAEEHQFTARMDGTLTDYHRAPGGEGPLAAEWKDKPHRLLYDLLGEVQALRAERDAARLDYARAFDRWNALQAEVERQEHMLELRTGDLEKALTRVEELEAEIAILITDAQPPLIRELLAHIAELEREAARLKADCPSCGGPCKYR